MITVEETVMKKLFSILGLVGFAGALAVGAGVGVKNVKVAKATSTYFQFGELGEIAANGTSGNFKFINAEKCDAKPGSVVVKDSRYWTNDGCFNGMDNFFKGESAGWAGIIKSDSWVQSSTDKYVYFTWTGDAQTIRIYADGVNDAIETLANDFPNGNAMIVNFIKIPDAYCDGTKVLHLEIEDPSTDDSGYRFSNFGYCHVNATAKEVSDAIWKHIEEDLHHDTNETRDRYFSTLTTYSKAKYKPITKLSDNARTEVDEDFNDNATFLSNWTRDVFYDDGDLGSMHTDTIISTITHRVGDTNLPINKTGTGFFKGFYEDGTGFVPTDGARYRFVSKPFILSGTGFISVKMAGRSASLHIVRGSGTNSDGENEINHDLLWANVKTYKDVDQGNVATSKQNSVTLVRHVLNLSAFLGEIIQIAIADTDTAGGWGAVNFDELITYYPDYPTFTVDTAVQKNTIHPYYLDQYISGDSSSAQDGMDYRESEKESTVDNSPVKEAYGFLQYYYTNFRAEGAFFSCCNVTDNTKSELISKYSALSKEAQAIVDDSDDFDYGSVHSGNWWEKVPTVGGDAHTVGYNVQYIARRFNITGIEIKNTPMVSSNQMELPVVMNNTVLVVVLISTLVALTFVMFIALKKRKQN